MRNGNWLSASVTTAVVILLGWSEVFPVAVVAATMPDLVPTAFTVPASVGAGYWIETSWTVENQGDGEAQPYWYDFVYFSTDNVWDNQDTELPGFMRTDALAVGASYSQTRRSWLPQVPAGTYYLMVRIDRGNSVYESNEANNEAHHSIEVRLPGAVDTP